MEKLSFILQQCDGAKKKKVFLSPFKLDDHVFPFFLFIMCTIISCLFLPLK